MNANQILNTTVLALILLTK